MQKIPYHIFQNFEHEFQTCDEYKHMRLGQAFCSWSGIPITPELFYEKNYKVAREKILEAHVFYGDNDDGQE